LTIQTIDSHGTGGDIPVDASGFEAETNLSTQRYCRFCECPCVLAFNGPENRIPAFPSSEGKPNTGSFA